MLFSFGKALILVFWVFFSYNLIKPFANPYETFFLWAGIFLLLIHLLEFFMQRKKLVEKNAGGILGFIQTMLFGLFYWLPILKKKI